MSRTPLGRQFACFALVALAIVPQIVSGQDYIGVLPEMKRPEVAESLQLTDEQRDQVDDLLRQRRGALLTLGQQVREATPDQAERLEAEFRAESEKMAFELLNKEQQSKLAKIRIELMGLLSLADPEVANALNLADWQRDVVEKWAGRVRRDPRDRNAARTRNEAQQAIRAEISDSQWDAWQLMAGLITESTSGPPVPPVFEETSPADTDSPQVVANAEQNALIPIDQVQLELSFNGQPWGDVIKWFADQADLSLQSDIIPPGSFNYRDRGRTYSVTEAMDIMNAFLLSTGHTLVKTGRMLRVVNFEEQDIAKEFISEVADWVEEGELAGRGDYEPVKFTFQLKRLDPEDVSADIEQLISVYGTVKSIPSTGEIVVTDMARNVRNTSHVEASGGSQIRTWFDDRYVSIKAHQRRRNTGRCPAVARTGGRNQYQRRDQDLDRYLWHQDLRDGRGGQGAEPEGFGGANGCAAQRGRGRYRLRET